MKTNFSTRVMSRIFQAERRTDVALEQQDYRMAWVTVVNAYRGISDPWCAAFCQIVGNTPDKAIPFWMARADLLADEYVPLCMIDLKYTRDWGSDYIRAKMAADAARVALPPKKPSVSIRRMPHRAGSIDSSASHARL